MTRPKMGQYGKPRPPALCRHRDDQTKMICSLVKGHGGDEHVAKGMDDQVLAAWPNRTSRHRT